MTAYRALFVLALSTGIHNSVTLDNGAGSRPILGWTTGERYPCLTDCENYPDDCISEHLVKMVVDILSLSSFHSAGYEYIVIGDCWMDQQRDDKGRLRADTKRFPRGMADLVNYIHRKDLKIGLNIDLGNTTCSGFPGSLEKYQLDAQTLAEWDVDMVTTSVCGFRQYHQIANAYINFGRELQETNRSILYACDWPIKSLKNGLGHPSYSQVSQTCNTFRVTEPVHSFETLTRTLNDLRANSYIFHNFTGKGSFLDLDELIVGGYGLSKNQEKFQMALWAMVSSPMLVASDLTSISGKSKRLLLNKAILDINQDPLGYVAKEKWSKYPVVAWTKPVMPTGSYAAAFFSSSVVGLPTQVSVELRRLEVTGSQRYNATELFTGHHYGVFKPWHFFNCEVESLGVVLIKFVPI